MNFPWRAPDLLRDQVPGDDTTSLSTSILRCAGDDPGPGQVEITMAGQTSQTMQKPFGGHSMTGRLRRVLLCAPDAAGWSESQASSRWRELGYRRAPDGAEARAQHDRLRHHLEDAGAEIVCLPAVQGASLDTVYVHDASFITNHGAVLMRMGKPARAAEPARHAELYRALDIRILGGVDAPGTIESGDIVWIDGQTLLVGRGYRTNQAGIEQLRALLAPHRVEVIEAPLPTGRARARACT